MAQWSKQELKCDKINKIRHVLRRTKLRSSYLTKHDATSILTTGLTIIILTYGFETKEIVLKSKLKNVNNTIRCNRHCYQSNNYFCWLGISCSTVEDLMPCDREVGEVVGGSKPARCWAFFYASLSYQVPRGGKTLLIFP